MRGSKAYAVDMCMGIGAIRDPMDPMVFLREWEWQWLYHGNGSGNNSMGMGIELYSSFSTSAPII